MVTRATGKLPIPKSADEFEDIATDALRIRYPHRSPIRFGRSGQKQHGIDGLDQQAPDLVWQSTLQRDGALAKITKDLAAMDAKFEDVETYVTCLGFERDKTLQLDLRKISGQRQLDGKCVVEVLFWEDLTDSVANDPAIFAKHFPQHSPSALQDELAKASLEDRDAARQPQLHIEFRGKASTTVQYEQHGIVVHNIGSCAFLVKAAELRWRVDAPGAPENTVRAPFRDQLVRPEESTTTTARVLLKDAAKQCEALGLARPDAMTRAPIVGTLFVEARSTPHEIVKTFNIPYQRPHPKVPEAQTRSTEARRSIMRAAYEAYMNSSTAWVIFRRPEDYPGWLDDIAREAKWLERRGWIRAEYTADSTITEVQLTVDGRDVYERDEQQDEPPPSNIREDGARQLRVKQHDDGTWSVDVEDSEGNTLHSEAGFDSKEEAQRAGTIWGAKQVALRAAREAFGNGGETKQ